MVISTDCIGSCESNYHTITTTTYKTYMYPYLNEEKVLCFYVFQVMNPLKAGYKREKTVSISLLILWYYNNSYKCQSQKKQLILSSHMKFKWSSAKYCLHSSYILGFFFFFRTLIFRCQLTGLTSQKQSTRLIWITLLFQWWETLTWVKKLTQHFTYAHTCIILVNIMDSFYIQHLRF